MESPAGFDDPFSDIEQPDDDYIELSHEEAEKAFVNRLYENMCQFFHRKDFYTTDLFYNMFLSIKYRRYYDPHTREAYLQEERYWFLPSTHPIAELLLDNMEDSPPEAFMRGQFGQYVIYHESILQRCMSEIVEMFKEQNVELKTFVTEPKPEPEPPVAEPVIVENGVTHVSRKQEIPTEGKKAK